MEIWNSEYFQKFSQDKEYEFLLEQWVKYRKEADRIELNGGKVTIKLHKKYFSFCYDIDKYQKAKMDSLRPHKEL